MKARITVLVITIVVIISGILVYEKENEEIRVGIQSSETIEVSGGTAGNDNSDNQQASDDTVFAYICGEVHEPGVYELGTGSRIVDLLEMAGGFTEDASETFVNLAEPVKDGMKVYIPSQDEVENKLVQIEGEETLAENSALININTADVSQLVSLPGIGTTKAESIVNYREQNGYFSCTEEIMNVSGIGESTYEKIRNLITVSD
ncbi:MAG: helix-hairpin-helix domain-containing protein [Lachnospiraceae bacterium]